LSSDVSVCGVAGNAASTCATLFRWEVLLALCLGCCCCDSSGESWVRLLLPWAVVVVMVGDAVLSSLRLRVTGGSLVTAVAAPSL